MPSTEPESPGYHQKYRNLKRKLKVLIYENECFQEELKKAQRKLLKVARDKSFLLDRLLRYETVESSTSDSDATVSSDSETELKAEILAFKKKRSAPIVETQETNCNNNNPNSSVIVDMKKKKSRKTVPVKPGGQQSNQSNLLIDAIALNHGDGHMTSEEIERHLEAKQALRDLMPEKAPLTVPVEMFSNELSGIDCEIHDGPTNELSPNNVTEGVSEDDGLIIDLHE